MSDRTKSEMVSKWQKNRWALCERRLGGETGGAQTRVVLALLRAEGMWARALTAACQAAREVLQYVNV